MIQLSLTHQTSAARVGEPPYPAIIMLHGLGSNEADLMSIAPFVDERLYVISVRAPLQYQWGGYAWYDLDRHGPGLGTPSITSALDQLRDFIHEATSAYSLDRNRIYTGGFSMGAAMAGATALLQPDLVQGAVMASGYLPPDPENQYRVEEIRDHTFFQAHGTLDQVVPITYGRQTRDFLASTPVDLTYKEYPIGHEVSMDELQDLSTWMTLVLDAHELRTQPR